ncbi:hypothetical protein K435DRAFT_930672 [Dendrothele bispora CBS 962.96]|uniref:FAD/NAD(P)-binding domain-containing protein n=1 Tax=Dendrothele bispora (strain CBS 962.96) TaxID=1314807 RepID=A0A4S8ME96_DENBC|nr:hypothetical protein K435DRAFT_930672 [Dendrothele bispora CBS 962.96]
MIIGFQPAIYLARANFDSVLFKDSMGNGFTAGGQRAATVNVKNFPSFPTGILGPGLMDKFRERSLRFGTRIITETISKFDLSAPRTEEPETADTVIVATGASAKRLGLKGEEVYWHSETRAYVVHVGAVPIFRNKPLAVIGHGGGDSAVEEVTCTSYS